MRMSDLGHPSPLGCKYSPIHPYVIGRAWLHYIDAIWGCSDLRVYEESKLFQTPPLQPWRTVSIVMFAIIFFEFLIMLFLDSPFKHSGIDLHKLELAMEDSFYLGLIMSPLVYFLLLLPLRRKTIMEQENIRVLKDDLTSLPTRRFFEELVNQEIGEATRHAASCALIVIDPARVSDINQAFGYAFGDLMIKEIGSRLKHLFSKFKTEARISGDEFAILIPSANEEDIAEIVGDISQALSEPFQVNGVSLDIGITMGVAIFPHHANDAALLIQKARIALSKAKNALIAYAIFDQAMESDAQNRIKLYREIRRALETNNFELHYQPQMNLESQQLVGVEALLRWPPGSSRLDARLIPFSEQVGLINQITRWVASEAIRQVAAWQAEGQTIPVSINISSRDLLHGEIHGLFSHLCEENQVAPNLITIEITESAIMEHPEKSFEILRQLRADGFRISIDDFGTGYSSLTYLRDMPADEIKIDRSFVCALDGDPKSHALVNLIVQFGKRFNLSVVAEGVETAALSQFLKKDGCMIGQGHYFSRPKPAQEFLPWHLETVERGISV